MLAGSQRTGGLSQQIKNAWQGGQGGRKQHQRARQTVATSQTGSLAVAPKRLQQIRATRFKEAWHASMHETVA